jgi:hypothetical protein
VITKDPSPDLLTATERKLGCWVVNGDDLQPRDVLVFLGEQYVIASLPSAKGRSTLLDRLYPEQDVRVIVVGSQDFTWAVPSQMYRILPRPGQPEEK